MATGRNAMPGSNALPGLEVAEPLLSHEPARALGVLLALYRTTWHPRLATLITNLGAQLGSPVTGLPVKQTERAAQLASLIAAAPDEQVTPLLDATALFLASGQAARVYPVVEAWAERPADPRVADAVLVALGGQGRVRELTAKLARRLLSCAERHGAAASAEVVRSLEQGAAWNLSPNRLANLATKLARRPPGLLDEALLGRMLARVPAPLVPTRPESPGGVSEDELVSAVIAAPDDDAPRLMLADWLTERGDGRGEFIALQVARAHGPVSAEARRREEELLQQHRVALLGPFDGRVQRSNVRFERGFLVRATLTADLVRHPLVKLLEDVEFGRAAIARELRLERLTQARRLSLHLLPELMQQAPRLDSALTWLQQRGAPWTVTRELLARCPRPLRKLGLQLNREPESFAFVLRQVCAHPATVGLEALEVDFLSGVVTSAVLADLPKSLERLSVKFVNPWVTLDLQRAPTGWRATVLLGFQVLGVDVWLQALAASGVTSLKVQVEAHVRHVLETARRLCEPWPFAEVVVKQPRGARSATLA